VSKLPHPHTVHSAEKIYMRTDETGRFKDVGFRGLLRLRFDKARPRAEDFKAQRRRRRVQSSLAEGYKVQRRGRAQRRRGFSPPPQLQYDTARLRAQESQAPRRGSEPPPATIRKVSSPAQLAKRSGEGWSSGFDCNAIQHAYATIRERERHNKS